MKREILLIVILCIILFILWSYNNYSVTEYFNYSLAGLSTQLRDAPLLRSSQFKDKELAKFLNNIYSDKPYEFYKHEGIDEYKFKKDECDVDRKLTTHVLDDLKNVQVKYKRKCNTIHRAKISISRRTTLDFDVIQAIPGVTKRSLSQLPECLDLRFTAPDAWNAIGNRPYEGIISSSFDQKDCGASWSFSVTGVLTDRLRLANMWYPYTPVEFTDMDGLKRVMLSQISPYLLIGCSWCGSEASDGIADIIMEQKECNLKCDGGLVEFAFMYIHKHAITTTACNTTRYQYSCHSYKNIQDILLPNIADHHCGLSKFGSAIQVNPYEYEQLTNAKNLADNELSIMDEVYRNGPVTAVFGVPDEFYTFFEKYPDGVFDLNGDCTKLQGQAVSLIGWGITKDKTKYWLARNSFGWNWGDQGFFRIKKGVNLCGIESDLWCAKPDKSWLEYRVGILKQEHEEFLKQHKEKV
jgi:hypothetical protein